METSGFYVIDENGYPMVPLANVPDSGASTQDPDAKSGNPQHDTRSGKFAPGSKQGDPDPNLPANVGDANAYHRKQDAVRDLARENDALEVGDIQEFLANRTNRPLTPEELQQLVADVRIARINDLVDILDYQFRNLIESIKRGRRTVKVSAPKGWIRRTFNGLTDDEILSVINRLEARGHDRKDLSRSIIGRIRKSDRAERLGARLAELPPEGEGLDLSYQDQDLFWSDDNHEYDNIENGIPEALNALAKKNEQPIIVNVNVENKPTRKIIKRDQRGNIESVEDVRP